MKIAFNTLGCPDWSMSEIVECARRLGYDGIEMRFLAGNIDLLAAPELGVQHEATAAVLREAKLEICCLGSSVRFDEPSAGKRAEELEIGRQYIDLARAMGIPFVRVHGDSLSKAESPAQAIDWVVEGLQRLAAYAADTGVTVLIESHGDFARSVLLREVMERVAAPQAGILWDTHHPWRFHGEPPHDTVAAIGRWIRHTHWKDSVRADDARGYRYVLFGEGEMPVRERLTALQSIRYNGWLSFEWEKKWHPSIEEPEVAFPQFITRMRALLAG